MTYLSKQRLIRFSLVIALTIILIQNFPDDIARSLFVFIVAVVFTPYIVGMWSALMCIFAIGGHAIWFLQEGNLGVDRIPFYSGEKLVLYLKSDSESLGIFLANWKGVEIILQAVYPPVWLFLIAVICFLWHKILTRFFEKLIRPTMNLFFEKLWTFVMGGK